MPDLESHSGCCGRDDPHYHEDEVWAVVAAEQAERYAALTATFGEDNTNAMLAFPWSPPVPREKS
ncbi:hypothetical protein SEA_WINGET_7 [Mycobacterium phage Winget]|nr:hypothetical protein SEA_WINGET_7 [Mycobacterium phage Winget]